MEKIQYLNNKKQAIYNVFKDNETGHYYLEFHDFNSYGKDRPWKSKKIQTLFLADIYFKKSSYKDDYWYKKAERLLACGDTLCYRIDENDKKIKLKYANSCRVRMCPLCNWRRERKLNIQLSKVIKKVTQNPDNQFILLTLTVPNCTGNELSNTVTKLLKGFNLLTKWKPFRQNIKGYFRALEVTVNKKIKSKNYGTYHPHIHVLLEVDKSYFLKSNPNYITQAEWLAKWQSIMHDKTISQVDVRKVKGTDNNIAHAVLEVAKYTVKDSDYIIPNNLAFSIKATETLDLALARRRLVAFGGELKTIHNELNFDDAIDGDLVSASGDSEPINFDDEDLIWVDWIPQKNNYYFRLGKGKV